MAGAAARLAPLQRAIRRTPGEMLRSTRLAHQLTMRDVVVATYRLADHFGNAEFRISLAHLSEIEAGGEMPNLKRICSLAMIYELDILELVAWFIPEIGTAKQLSAEAILFGFPNNVPRCA